MSTLYQALIALIVTNFDTDYPNSASGKFIGRPIFQGYQNNFQVPANGNYVVITALPEENQILNPSSRSIDLDAETQVYDTVLSSGFQVDFYGINAQQNARTFQLLMNSDYGNNFFVTNSYNCTVNRVKEVVNLTDVFGRDMYLPRFMVICSLFNNPTKTAPLPVFNGVVNDIRLADVQT